MNPGKKEEETPVKTFDILVLVAVLGGANGVCLRAFGSESGETPTKVQRLKFLAGYHSWSPAERREAARLLTQPEYRDNREIGNVLYEIAWFNTDPEVRLSVFQALCTWRDEDGSLARLIACIFRHEPEPAIKPSMAQAMTRLAFKTDVLNELITYIRLPRVARDTDWDTGYEYGDRSASAGRLPNRNGYAPHRTRYQILLDSINKVSGKHFVASNDTGRELVNWWRLNAVDFRHADSELAQEKKNGSESQAALADLEPRRNPGADMMATMLKDDVHATPQVAMVNEDDID